MLFGVFYSREPFNFVDCPVLPPWMVRIIKLVFTNNTKITVFNNFLQYVLNYPNNCAKLDLKNTSLKGLKRLKVKFEEVDGDSDAGDGGGAGSADAPTPDPGTSAQKDVALDCASASAER